MTRYCMHLRERADGHPGDPVWRGGYLVRGVTLVERAEIPCTAEGHTWWVVEDEGAPPELFGKLVEPLVGDVRDGAWEVSSWWLTDIHGGFLLGGAVEAPAGRS